MDWVILEAKWQSKSGKEGETEGNKKREMERDSGSILWFTSHMVSSVRSGDKKSRTPFSLLCQRPTEAHRQEARWSRVTRTGWWCPHPVCDVGITHSSLITAPQQRHLLNMPRTKDAKCKLNYSRNLVYSKDILKSITPKHQIKCVYW